MDLSIGGRRIGKYRHCRDACEAVPITPEFYASLHKVSCLVASRLTTPEGLRNRSESQSMWDGLSGLLLYVTTLLVKIHNGTFLTLSPSLMDIYSPPAEGKDRYPESMHSGDDKGHRCDVRYQDCLEI
jgi:hypothetical protein